MIPVAAGLALMVPNVMALAGIAGLLAAVEIQVRVIEEPYLMRTHGSTYRDYAARVGRFFPGIGRMG
jgi:protein-S-isoprenylcysteine O-methyltransferase Ste14